MTSNEKCPKCGSDWRGKEIPEGMRYLYGDTHYSRLIGYEDPNLYDGIAWWICPDCAHVMKHLSWAPDLPKETAETLVKELKEIRGDGKDDES